MLYTKSTPTFSKCKKIVHSRSVVDRVAILNRNRRLPARRAPSRIGDIRSAGFRAGFHAVCGMFRGALGKAGLQRKTEKGAPFPSVRNETTTPALRGSTYTLRSPPQTHGFQEWGPAGDEAPNPERSGRLSGYCRCGSIMARDTLSPAWRKEMAFLGLLSFIFRLIFGLPLLFDCLLNGNCVSP